MTKFLLFLSAIVILSCKYKKTKTTNEMYQMFEVTEHNNTPTVDIKKYALIQNKDRKEDAKKILNLKRNWPLVMQSPSKMGFDTLLSANFTFIGDGHLLTREEYITERTKPSDWIITYVKYDNLTLQFFDNRALLTYKNQVTNENIKTKEVEIEYISWADTYVFENNKWKIEAAHTIDFRIEKKD